MATFFSATSLTKALSNCGKSAFFFSCVCKVQYHPNASLSQYQSWNAFPSKTAAIERLVILLSTWSISFISELLICFLLCFPDLFVRFCSVPFILLPHSVSPQAQFLVLSRTARIHTDLPTTTHSCYYTYSYSITISLDESCTNNILRSKEWHETDIFQEVRIYIFKYLRGLK